MAAVPRILVTGGTGTLGKSLVPALEAAAADFRVLTRAPRSTRHVFGDLSTGSGLDEALTDAAVIIHAASDTMKAGKADPLHARQLIAAAKRCGNEPHLVYVSIAAIDRVDMAYYRRKRDVEQLVQSCGLPWTIQRATQFHDLLSMLFRAQAKLPVLIAPHFPIQPISTDSVATRLVELAVDQQPTGRAPDIGGPEIADFTEFARQFKAQNGWRKPVVAVPIFGNIAAALKSGALTCDEGAVSGPRFIDYLARLKRPAP